MSGCKKGRARRPALPKPLALTLFQSGPRTRANLECVVSVVGDLPPQIFFVLERHQALKDFLEIGIVGGGLCIHLVRGLETGLHNRGTERTQHGAASDKALQRLWIPLVVAGLYVSVGVSGCGGEDRLIILWQAVPLFEIDEVVQRRRAFPPARVVIVLRDFVETE